jgi:hypothetical protein
MGTACPYYALFVGTACPHLRSVVRMTFFQGSDKSENKLVIGDWVRSNVSG